MLNARLFVRYIVKGCFIYRARLPTSGALSKGIIDNGGDVLVVSTEPNDVDLDQVLFSLHPSSIDTSRKGSEFSIQRYQSVAVTSDDSVLRLGYILVSSTGLINSYLWTAPDTVPLAYKVNNPSAFSWSVDPCWQLIYMHDDEGNANEGSLSALLTAVRSGKAIRVLSKNFAFRPSVLYVRNDHVTALGSRMGRKSLTRIAPNLIIKYSLISTTGLQQNIKYKSFVAVPESDANSNVFWYVGTQDYQKSVRYSLDTQSFTTGDTDVLKTALDAGKDARMAVDIDDYEVYFDLNRFTNDVSGVAFGVTLTTSGSSDFTWQSSPYTWANLLVFQSGNPYIVRQDDIDLDGTSFTSTTLSDSSSTYVDIYTSI